MSSLEIKVTKAFPQIFKTWHRYVDDIFAIVNKKLADDALKLLNLQDNSIKFTAEVESENFLPFLDIKIMRNHNSIEFGIFRKTTHVDNYIKQDGYNPNSHKQAIFNSLTFRLVNIPMNSSEYNNEYQHILDTALKNGFNTDIVNKKIKKFEKQKLIRENCTLSNIKDETTFKKFTFHPKIHYKFEKTFKEVNIRLAPINRSNIKTLLKSGQMDKIPPKKNSGIYELKCKDCSKLYIGKTKRNLNIRHKEHLRNIKYKQTDKSAVAHHFWTTEHEFEDDIKLLKSVTKPKELTIWEKNFIQKNKNNLVNFDIPKENDLITTLIRPTETSTGLPANSAVDLI